MAVHWFELTVVNAKTGEQLYYSILKFFQVDNAGMLRMTSSARYFKEVVGPSRPS